MARDRNHQKQIWTDPDFAKTLTKLKAKLLLKNGSEISIAQLTKKILQCKTWEKLEQELINIDVDIQGLRIKTDKRL